MKDYTHKKMYSLLALLSSYCIAILLYRVWYTSSILYGFLVWNLILAYVPFFITNSIKTVQLKTLPFFVAFVIWLLFLPNAPYIITDIFHLKRQTSMPVWFDLLLVISFAFNGIVLFFLSVYDMYTILQKNFSVAKAWIITTCIFFLTGFGIYLGRFLRFNSWDVLSNPNILIVEIFDRIIQPVSHPRTWGFTLGFGTLLLIGFLIFKTINSKEERVRI